MENFAKGLEAVRDDGVNDAAMMFLSGNNKWQYWGAGRSRCSKARMAPFQEAVSCSLFRTSLQWFDLNAFHIVFHLKCKTSIAVLQCRWFDLQGTRSWKSARNARRSSPWQLRFAYPKVEQIVECTSYILKFYWNAIMRPETKTRFLLQWRKPRCLVKRLEAVFGKTERGNHRQRCAIWPPIPFRNLK